MAAEYSASVSQIVSPNQPVIFQDAPVPCKRGLVYYREGSGIFRLASPSLIRNGNTRRCCCQGSPVADYVVSFNGRVQIPTGGTAGTISMGISIDGEVDPASIMSITPSAIEEPGMFGMQVVVSVPWICRCGSLSVRNIGTADVEVLNGVITIEYSGIR